MTVGLISDCVHFYSPNGKVASANHIYIRQMEALSNYFDKMIICCPFDTYNETTTASIYQKKNIEFMPLPNVGGDTFSSKLKLIAAIPKWFSAFYKINKKVDIIYQRFPNNLNIPGFFFFYIIRKKVFATYTGTWGYDETQPFTYRLQKWFLKKLFRGPVWVYAEEEQLAKNIYGGFSPSYTLQEWNEETEQVQQRIARLNNDERSSELKMISVGTLNDNKNQIYLLHTCLQLIEAAIPFHLTLVGEGPLKEQFKQFVQQNNLQQNVTITGGLNYSQLRSLYRQNDFVVQAAISEGFGKVPVEGFFHGLLPVLHQSALAPYMTGRGERGFLFNAIEANSLFNMLKEINTTISAKLLADMIYKGRIFAKTQTLENWAEGYHKKIVAYFG